MNVCQNKNDIVFFFNVQIREKNFSFFCNRFWWTKRSNKIDFIDFLLMYFDAKSDANFERKNEIYSILLIFHWRILTRILKQILSEKINYNQFHRFFIDEIWRKLWFKFLTKKRNTINFIDFSLTKSDANSDANFWQKNKIQSISSTFHWRNLTQTLTQILDKKIK